MMLGAPWLEAAYAELRRGVREIPGPEAQARITLYHAATSLQATSDEVPWCSAFVCWCMDQAKIASPGSARARDWLTWGAKLSPVHPATGAVVVMARGNGPQPGREVLDAPGHVGLFWCHGEPGRIILLGGNQGDAVSLGNYPVHRLLGVRWPEEGGRA